jgi:hypothetical protein
VGLEQPPIVKRIIAVTNNTAASLLKVFIHLNPFN